MIPEQIRIRLPWNFTVATQGNTFYVCKMLVEYKSFYAQYWVEKNEWVIIMHVFRNCPRCRVTR